MNNTNAGYILLIAAVGMFSGMIALDIGNLESWEFMTTPKFVGKTLLNISSVIAAFVGGKLLPSPPENRSGKYTRASDDKTDL